MTENTECLILKYTATKSKRHKWDYEEIIASRCFVLNKYYSEKFRLNPINEIELQSEIPDITNTGDSEWVIGKLEFIENISEKLYDDIKRFNLSDNEEEITKLINKVNESVALCRIDMMREKFKREKEKILLNK
jgi:hypothetical protein